MRRFQKGFTLMELMVVIVIVAILAAVAVPLYINYVKDAQRTEAKGAIGAVVTAQQTYFQQHQTYAPNTEDSDWDGVFVTNPTSANQDLNCDLTDALNHWIIKVTEADADHFVVQANGKTTGPAKGLCVAYTFKRTNPPADPWNDDCTTGTTPTTP